MKALVIVFILLTSLTSRSQISSSAGMTFQLPIAMNEYAAASGSTANAGARMNIYMRPAPAFPLQFGIDAGLFGRGNASATLPLDIAGYAAEYVLKASNSVFNIGFLVKFEPFSSKRFSPYIEGEIGGNDFYSSVYFYRKGRSGDSQRIKSNDDTNSHWGLYYGGSAGLRMAFGKMRMGGIELKCSYLKGAQTTYNDKPAFTESGTVVFERLSSTTDMLIPQIGVWMNLRDMNNEQAKLNKL
jgi:hypothetical protein